MRWLLKPVSEEWKARIREVFPRPPLGSDPYPEYGSPGWRLLDEMCAEGFFLGSMPCNMTDDMLRETEAWG